MLCGLLNAYAFATMGTIAGICAIAAFIAGAVTLMLSGPGLMHARRFSPAAGILGGWRYSLWVTNRPAATKGWLGQHAYIDAAHRVHARVEDAIRTGKNCGIGRFPSGSLAMNKAWQAAALTAAGLLAWLRLLALDGC